ncbi:hypothetical protein E1B28_002805 [Marasmius oreades]|uniref:Uncharacterized protein n=1 Tax=Marasmius oreades TaxID=181124 RepID=A0A9P7UMC3_9AGAR|nr:uncharacterized protein E1B28_002805 [Marasmius oreades]KAG7086885.1 hypothetical protein E1B28_002805 [Marasmius oreades]
MYLSIANFLAASASVFFVFVLVNAHTPEPDTIFPFNPGFNIQKVSSQASILPSHSWEYGTASEALLELYNRSLSVFGCNPFPPGPGPESLASGGGVPGLEYASQKIVIGDPPNGLADGDGAVGDPASLGVSAVMLGLEYADAARREVEYLVEGAPRWENGAISHRVEAPELWADFVYMAPPFIAYYGVVHSDFGLLQEAVRQCGLYREVLRDRKRNVWEHIVGPTHPDPGLWSTGNAWAAAGMTRVLATVVKAPHQVVSSEDWREDTVGQVSSWIKEIVDGAMESPMDGGLLRNYLNDTDDDGHGYGEISGTSLLGAVVYRMAVLQPRVFGGKSSRYIRWADGIRKTLGGRDDEGKPHVTEAGIVTPAVNPLDWGDTVPFTSGSPEGQNFVVLLYAAWRDCVWSGQCTDSEGHTQADTDRC